MLKLVEVTGISFFNHSAVCLQKSKFHWNISISKQVWINIIKATQCAQYPVQYERTIVHSTI